MILILFLGNTAFDSRSQKFIEALKSAGLKYIAVELTEKSNHFTTDYFRFAVQFFKTIFSHKISSVICMDVFCVPFAVFLKTTQSLNFHFDARELNAEVFAFRTSKLKSFIWGTAEWLGFMFSQSATCVNKAIQQIFHEKYQIEPTIIFNFPHRSSNGKYDLIRDKFGLHQHDFLWIFQGGLQHGRGIDFAVSFINNRPEHEKLIFIGENKLGTGNTISDSRKIFFTGAIPNNSLLNWTSSGDAGLIFIDDSSKSYHLSLPNKFFEYIFAEIPVLSFDLPEISAFVFHYKCGLISTRGEIHQKADRIRSGFSLYQSGSKHLKNELMKTDQITIIKNLLLNDHY